MRLKNEKTESLFQTATTTKHERKYVHFWFSAYQPYAAHTNVHFIIIIIRLLWPTGNGSLCLAPRAQPHHFSFIPFTLLPFHTFAFIYLFHKNFRFYRLRSLIKPTAKKGRFFFKGNTKRRTTSVTDGHRAREKRETNNRRKYQEKFIYTQQRPQTVAQTVCTCTLHLYGATVCSTCSFGSHTRAPPS